MAAVPVVNNLLAQRPFFMIKIHRQNLSTFIKILICLLFNKIIQSNYKEMQTNTILFLWRLVNYEKQFSTRIQPSDSQRYDT